ncbi:MAG: T9SS type A sorting domain-containing protein [Bacteroidales bacterium]|nr:T9SS type A sorting domain-containing protein [Bacteroidales bacterium]
MLPETSNRYKVEVINTTGQVVLAVQFSVDGKVVEVDFSQMESEYYLVKVISHNQVYVTKDY